jgi:hypothetical protein
LRDGLGRQTWSFKEGRTTRQLWERCHPQAAGGPDGIVGGGGGRERIWSAHAGGQPLIFFSPLSGTTILTNGDAIVSVEILTLVMGDLQVPLPFSKVNKR